MGATIHIIYIYVYTERERESMFYTHFIMLLSRPSDQGASRKRCVQIPKIP